MKKLTIALATAGLLATAAPAMAFVGFHVGPVGVGVGGPGPYYGYNGCGYNYPCGGPYYDYYGGPNVVIGGGGGWHGHSHFHHWHHR
ncbi:MAG TPA: hypothetical protein VHX43_02535 [Xanthobacteraceae bacterium]|jgi:hypothetical protein|nr:hypothetical protein [Xanthobacteraceae bacterium]